MISFPISKSFDFIRPCGGRGGEAGRICNFVQAWNFQISYVLRGNISGVGRLIEVIDFEGGLEVWRAGFRPENQRIKDKSAVG